MIRGRLALAAAALCGCAGAPVERCAPHFEPLTYAMAARALETGSDAACAGSGALYTRRFQYPNDGERTVPEQCRRLYAYMHWLRAVMLGGPGVKELCLKTGYDVFAPADMAKACDIIVAVAPRDPASAAVKLEALLRPGALKPEDRERFAEDQAVSVGLADEKVCARRDTEACLAPIRFRKAHDAKDASLCGSSGLCLGMMGAKDAARPYREALARLNCDIIPGL